MRIKKFLALDAMGVVFVNEDDIEELLIPFLKTRNDNIDIEKLRDLYYSKASLGKISSRARIMTAEKKEHHVNYSTLREVVNLLNMRERSIVLCLLSSGLDTGDLLSKNLGCARARRE